MPEQVNQVNYAPAMFEETPFRNSHSSLRIQDEALKGVPKLPLIVLFLAASNFSFLYRAGFSYRCLLYYRLYSRSGRCFYTYLYT